VRPTVGHTRPEGTVVPPDGEFDEFYRASAGRLVGALFVVTGDLHLAEDVVQEAFVRASARWEKVRAYDRPDAWVRRVALNLARSHVRGARRQLAAMLRHGGPDDAAEHAPDLTPDRLAVRAALAGLAHIYREVLVLHYVLDLPIQQIAAELDVPLGTVKARLHRGRRALAAQGLRAEEEGSS